MKNSPFQTLPFLIFMALIGCSDKNYPENMTAQERKEYYNKFNKSKSPEEWEEIRRERKTVSKEEFKEPETPASDRIVGSIPFSIKNNSLFPKKLRIEDNILSFHPFEKRYVGFYPSTKVYLITGDMEDKFLFEISANDRGKSFDINP